MPAKNPVCVCVCVCKGNRDKSNPNASIKIKESFGSSLRIVLDKLRNGIVHLGKLKNRMTILENLESRK